MNTKTKIRSLLLLAMMFIIGTANGWCTTPESVKNKVYNKSFEVSPNDRLVTNNCYGNTTITYWDMNEVSIRVEIEVKAKKESLAQEMLDRIQIELCKTDNNTIYASTSFKKGLDLSGNFSINYFINLPSQMTINLAQRYGNINIPAKTEGKSTIQVKYGNLKAGSFTQPLNLTVKYGNVNVGDLAEAKMDLGYCSASSIGNAEQLNIDCKYSDIDIKKCGKINISNKYSNVSIESLDKGEMDIKYGDTEIDSLQESLSISDLAYCTLDIDNLSAGFKTLDVDARYGNLNVKVSPEASFEVNTENMKYGKHKIKGLNITSMTEDDDDNNHYKINNGGGGVIRFNGNRYSSIQVKSL